MADNLRKAAILVATLDGPTADRVLDSVPEECAARLRRTIVELGDLDAAEQETAIGEFFRASSPESSQGSDERALDSAPGVESDGVEFICSSEAAGDGAVTRPFAFFEQARGEELSPLLAGEHPQTIALIASQLSPDRAAAALGALEGALRADVLRRLVDLEEADPDVLREIERGIESRVLEDVRQERRRAAGLNAVAGIVEAAEPALKRELLANLAQHDRQLAERLRPQSCEFADLEWMDPRTLATLLSSVESDLTLLALAGAPLSLVEHVLGQFSPLQAKQAWGMIERMGPTRLADIDEAQRQIAQRARQLALEGRIELPTEKRRKEKGQRRKLKVADGDVDSQT